MKTLEPILRAHPFFKDLDPRFLELLVGCASNVVYKPGAFICHEGDAANQFYIIRQGQVAVEVYAPGRGSIVLETLSAGDILGWSWLIPPYHWHSDVRAIELTRAIALNGECLRMKCNADHDLGYELLKRFSGVIVASLEAARLQLVDVYGAVPA